MQEIYLIRHAESIYDSRVPDARRPLSERGRRQADRLVGQLEQLGIEEIHTSPYERCLQTIAPLSRTLGLEPRLVHDLRERTFTQSHVEDWATMWKTAWMDPDFALADGESGRQAQARMHAAVTRLVKQSTVRTLAVSSHGNVIGLLLQHIDPRFGLEQANAIRNPDVLRVTYDGRLRWDCDLRLAGLDAFATTFGATTLDSSRGDD